MMYSIVIPAYNEEKYIGKTLDSILKNTPDSLVEILVVDNASTDKTAEIATNFEKVRVVKEDTKGLTHARQKGLEEAKGDILAYIDADTQISKDWYKILEKKFNQNQNLVCLSGPYNYFDLPRWQRYLMVGLWNTSSWLITRLGGVVAYGGNLAIRKNSMLEAGGFDKKISFYGEDTNVVKRLKKYGDIEFVFGFMVFTSARRFKDEGLVRVGFRYLINYIWMVFFHKPFSNDYTDIR